MTIRLSILDDHDVVIQGIRLMAERTPDLELLDGVREPDALLRALSKRQPDILLLDVVVGSGRTFDLCAGIAVRFPRVRVVMFSGFGDTDLLRRSIRAGAIGFVLKDARTDDLPDALRTVRREGSYFDPRVAGPALLASLKGDPQHDDAPDLTERELAVLRMIATGATNQEIAAELYVSVHTVKVQVSRLLREFEVRRRADLVREAYARGLV